MSQRLVGVIRGFYTLDDGGKICCVMTQELRKPSRYRIVVDAQNCLPYEDGSPHLSSKGVDLVMRLLDNLGMD